MQRRTFIGALSAGALLMTTGSILKGADASAGEVAKNIVRRQPYYFTVADKKFRTGKGNVAFLGGSITEMDGYRPMVCEYLKKKYPQTQFNFIDAGVSSTCSNLGAFRVDEDVIQRCEGGKGPDLFFVEYAVNDNQDGFFNLEQSIRGMEGVIRRIKAANPDAAIVMTFFANIPLMEKYRAGEIPTSIQAHTAVAEHYGISTVNVAKELQEEIDAGNTTWEIYGDVHPAPRGNRMVAYMIEKLLYYVWRVPATCSLCAIRSSEVEPLDPYSYGTAGWVDFDAAQTEGFTREIPDWSKIPGALRERFAGQELLCANEPGATFSLTFHGNAAGLYVLAGPDSWKIDVSVDGGAPTCMNVVHPYSGGLHYPRLVVLADGLATGEHRVTARLCENEEGEPVALRILKIGVNRGE